ncbi:hypothetical protein [Clostridium sp. SGI.024]|nr:hypothetical protein [Clostridium sp.]
MAQLDQKHLLKIIVNLAKLYKKNLATYFFIKMLFRKDREEFFDFK